MAARSEIVTTGLHQQTVTGATTLGVQHEHVYELTATSAATVTLDGFPGAQVAVVWSGTAGTVEGKAIADGETWVGVCLSSGWRMFLIKGVPTAPAAPVVSISGVTEATATAAWAAVAGATGYNVRVNGGATVNAGNVLTYTATGLSASTAGTIEVQSYNEAGLSVWVSEGFTTDEPAPTPLRLKGSDGSANVTESGSAGAGWNYAFAATPYGKGAIANDAVKIPAGVDGEVRFVITSSTIGSVHVLLNTSNSPNYGTINGDAIGLDTPVINGTNKYAGRVNPPVGASSVVAAAGDIGRIRRAGSTVYAEVSKDGGTTWTLIHSKSVASTPALYVVVAGSTFTAQLSNVRGVGFA